MMVPDAKELKKHWFKLKISGYSPVICGLLDDYFVEINDCEQGYILRYAFPIYRRKHMSYYVSDRWFETLDEALSVINLVITDIDIIVRIIHSYDKYQQSTIDEIRLLMDQVFEDTDYRILTI